MIWTTVRCGPVREKVTRDPLFSWRVLLKSATCEVPICTKIHNLLRIEHIPFELHILLYVIHNPQWGIVRRYVVVRAYVRTNGRAPSSARTSQLTCLRGHKITGMYSRLSASPLAVYLILDQSASSTSSESFYTSILTYKGTRWQLLIPLLKAVWHKLQPLQIHILWAWNRLAKCAFIK